MVLRGEMTSTRMTTRPERPTALHNFSLPSLKWGSQRQLTCSKIEPTSSGSGGRSGDHHRRRYPPLRFSDSSFSFGESDHRRNQRRRSRNAAFESVDDGGCEEEEEEGIEEFRVKLMSDLKTVRDKITKSMYALGEEQDEEEQPGHQEKEVSPVKPWNLRKRRAAAEERVVNPSPSRNDRTRVVVEAETTATAKEMSTSKRVKFSGTLSKKEIAEDFMAVVGHRPPRRPTKRTRTVQKFIDSLYPAFYLTEVTVDDYKVEEATKR